MKHKEYCILDSRSWMDSNLYSYDDYLEFCKDNGLQPFSKDSQEFDEWRYDESYLCYQNDLDNIKEYPEYNKEFVISGSLGLWNGRHDILPEKVDSLYDGIMKCLGNCDDIIVNLDKEGVVEVQAFHHDGCNSFTIRQLKDFCRGAYEKAVQKYYDTGVFEMKNGWFCRTKYLYQ